MTYLKEVIFVAIICGILSKLTLNDKGGCKKYVKYISSIIFLYILVSPLINEGVDSADLIDNFKKIPIQDETKSEDYSDYLKNIDYVSNEICKVAVESASMEFSVPEDSFSLKIILEYSESKELSIKEAAVCVTGDAKSLDSEKIKKFFDKILNTSTEVITDE